MMPDLIKRLQQSWCPYCRAPAGPDCPDVAIDRRTARKVIKRRMAREVEMDLRFREMDDDPAAYFAKCRRPGGWSA